MNCTIARKLLQHYLDSALDEVEARAVEHHVAECISCRGHFLSLERLALTIESLPRVAAPADTYQHIMVAATKHYEATERGPRWQWANFGMMTLFGLAGLLFALQSGAELAQSLSQFDLTDPYTFVDSLLAGAASLELSFVIGSALLFVAGCGAFMQLIYFDRSAKPA